MTTATKRPPAVEEPRQLAEPEPAEPLKRTAKGHFAPGNAGKRKGQERKATAEARSWALPLVPEVLAWRRKHRAGCDATKDCAMCRHYNDMVLHYAYGKPPQRHELIQATAKADTLRLAKELGLSETETKAALAEVDRALAAARNSS